VVSSAVAVTRRFSPHRRVSRRPSSLAPDPVILGLVAVARCRDQAGAAALSSVLKAADWDALLRAAEAHGMLGILHRRTADHCPGVVPARAAEALTAGYRACATRGLRQEARMLEVIDHLRESGIPCVPFKGPALARLVYGDVALRYATDLDVLVAMSDVARAVEVLMGSGWRLASQVQTDQHDLLEAAECELLLEHIATGLFLELHWRTGPRFAHASFAAEPLIARARPCELLGREVTCLRDSDHFLVLCVHGATHRWDQLELVCTIAEFIGGDLVSDWATLLDRAGRLECRRRVLVAAALARGLVGVDLPPAVVAGLADDPGVERLALAVAADLRAVPRPLAGVRRLRSIAWQAAALDTPGERLRHLIARVFVPGGRDLDWLTVPRSLAGVYYLLRPLRLAAQYAGRAFRID
jgi:hypothetical protein